MRRIRDNRRRRKSRSWLRDGWCFPWRRTSRQEPTHAQADAPYNVRSKEFLHGPDTVGGAVGAVAAVVDRLVDHVFGPKQGRAQTRRQRRARQQSARQGMKAQAAIELLHSNLAQQVGQLDG